MVDRNDMGPFQTLVGVSWRRSGFIVTAEWQSVFQSDHSEPGKIPQNVGKFLQFPQIGPSVESNFLGGADFASLAFADATNADILCAGSFNDQEGPLTGPPTVFHNDHYTFRMDWSNPAPPPINTINSSGGGTIDVFTTNGGSPGWSAQGGFLSGAGDLGNAIAGIQNNITSQGGTVTLFEILTGPITTDTTYSGGTFFQDSDNGVVLFNFARAVADEGSADDSIICHVDTGEGPVHVDEIQTFFTWRVKFGLYQNPLFANFQVDANARPSHWPPAIATVELSGTGDDGNTHFDLVVRPTADGILSKKLEIVNVSVTP